MMIKISRTNYLVEEDNVEIVERKGVGHPDTIADAISEIFSVYYSKYCIRKYGYILPHWVDKVVVEGATSEVSFGSRNFFKPIIIHIFGKVTNRVGKETIPVQSIIEPEIYKYLKIILPELGYKNVKIVLRTNNSVGAGRAKYWYQPNDGKDAKRVLDNLSANDATITVAYAGMSPTEMLTLDLEKFLNGKDFKAKYPETGSDIKILMVRIAKNLQITTCIPFIAKLTPNLNYYKIQKKRIIQEIKQFVRSLAYLDTFKVLNIYLNTRDRGNVVFLTAGGTAADTGDCGVTGRGNRSNGLITPSRPMSIEAPAGKNPVYHAGKLYSIITQRIANDIYNIHKCHNSVMIISQTGRKLEDPFMVSVKTAGGDNILKEGIIKKIIQKNLMNISEISKDLLKFKIRLF